MGVRWDAVVDLGAVQMRQPPSRAPAPVSTQSVGRVEVHVQLFGALASLQGERSVRLALPAGATIAEALAKLGERLGQEFLDRVLDEAGMKRRHCRLFVAGYAVEDLQTPLHAGADPTEIDIILLIAPEGG
jgi:molybdopterin converting factor small subunit